MNDALQLSDQQRAFIDRFIVSLGPGSDASERGGATEGSAIPKGIVAKRKFIITRWSKIPKELDVAVNAYCAAVVEELPYEDPYELMSATTDYVDELIDGMRASIDDALAEDINAGDPKYSRTQRAIGGQRKALGSDPVIAALKNNSLVPGGPFEQAFVGALDELEAELTR